MVAQPYTGCTPTDTGSDARSVVGEQRFTADLLDGPVSGDVATSAMHQIRGLALVVDVDAVGLVTPRAPTSGCRSWSRDARRTHEKALRASTSRRERRSATDELDAVAGGDANWIWAPAKRCG